jgi:hypothetical protein
VPLEATQYLSVHVHDSSLSPYDVFRGVAQTGIENLHVFKHENMLL